MFIIAKVVSSIYHCGEVYSIQW